MIEENDRDVGGCVYKGAGRIRACLLKKNPLSTQHGIRAKEMAQQPRVCYSAKDPSSIASTHILWFATTHSTSLREPSAFFWPPQRNAYTTCLHTETCTQTYRQTQKKHLKMKTLCHYKENMG